MPKEYAVTFSIVARDDKTGAFGVCGYTDIAGYGSIVPHVSLRGAAATQAYANVDNGLRMMELLETGATAAAAGRNRGGAGSAAAAGAGGPAGP